MNNELQEHHVMVLEGTHPSDAEEWYCPTRGRRILMRWPPSYKKIILEAGDEGAIHCVGNGGPGRGTPQFAQQPVLSAQDAARLVDWEQWLGQIGFETWWSSEI